MKKVILVASLLTIITGCQTAQTRVDADDELWYLNTKTSMSDSSKNEPVVENVVPVILPTDNYAHPIAVSYEPGLVNQAAERRALLDVLAHIEQTESLIRVAQAQQNPDQRIKFRYDWLRNDLGKMATGIRSHLNNPSSQPRTIEPLIGDYRR